MIEYVIKRDGSKEEFDPTKLNIWAEWASETCGVAWVDIIFDAIKTLHNGVSTSDIQKALIKKCVERRTEGHTKMAARLMLGVIYKEAFDDFSIPHLKDYYHHMVEEGFWDDMGYTDEELDILDTHINHIKDFDYTYATLRQFYDKYSQKSFERCLESPQMAFMGLAMSNMRDEENRLTDVILAYTKMSSIKVNLPTPTLALERSATLPAPSCCLIAGNDTVESIGAATHVAYTMTAKSAGIGFELKTRAPKDPVKNGRISHGGKHSYYSYVDRAVKANAQIVRGGSATVTYNVLDPEIEKLLTMKSQRTDPTYRLAHLDYSMAFNNLFLKKVAKNEDWMLVSCYYAPKLWELSYSGDQEAFEEEYNRVANSTVKKTFIPARSIFVQGWAKQRGDTGRLYLTFLDNINTHTPFKNPIRQSNLCQEIVEPTEGFDDVSDLYRTDDLPNGEVALCNLGAIVVSNIESDEDYEETSYILAKLIDNTIERGVYPFPAVEKSAKARRSIGVGIVDLAHEMARKGLKFDSQEGRNHIHYIAERHSYFLHKASVRLAKERGKCEWMYRTKYNDDLPWLPVDTYNKAIDEFQTIGLRYDWEELRSEIKKYGVRFSVLEAHMPTESSAVFSGCTNGVYPIREKEIFKSSRKGMVYFRAPNADTLEYQNAYHIDHLDLVKVYALIQKFTSQAISSDFYTVTTGEGEKISSKKLLQRVLLAAKLGMKTFYYENFKTGEEVKEMMTIGGSLSTTEEEGCEECKM